MLLDFRTMICNLTSMLALWVVPLASSNQTALFVMP